MKRALVLSCGGFKVAMQAYPISLLMGAYKYSAIFGTSGGVLNAVLAAQNPSQLIKVWNNITSPQEFVAKIPWTAGLLHNLDPLKQKIPQYIERSFSIPVYASWVAANTLTHHCTDLSTLKQEEIVDVIIASCTMSPWMAPHKFTLAGKTHWGIDGWFKSAIQIPLGKWDAIDVISTIPYPELSKTIVTDLLNALVPEGTLRLYCSSKYLGNSLNATLHSQRERLDEGKLALSRPTTFTLPLV